jgi:DMSO/TMAO reductase YedYZ molybdopterin-dependent catalytic subunit
MNKKITPNIHKKPSSLRYYQEGLPDIDLVNYRLKVTGAVKTELSLSYQDILDIPKIYFHRRNVCVCLWSIKRHWEGIFLKDLLNLAGVDLTNTELFLKQISVGTKQKGQYDSTIHMMSSLERDAMLAYAVDGELLSLEQGFPTRFIDFGLYLYKCVKGLSEIQVTQENKLGHWESYAGYDLDGTVKSKKYYAVDLQKKFYFENTGEVFDHNINGG